MLLALKAGMSISPPVPFLNRAQVFGSNAQQHNQSTQAWQGQRSGRIFRSVHSGNIHCLSCMNCMASLYDRYVSALQPVVGK